jgi:hypothetical protein
MQVRARAVAVGRLGAVLLVLSSLGFAACSSAPKAGSKDGGKPLDAGGDSGGFIRRRDGQITGGDPVPACQRFDPMPCGAGQQCRLVIRSAADAGAGQFLIYSGCVEDIAARPLGAPCDPWGGQSQLYAAEGLADEVYVDPCEQGLYCAPDLKIRDHYTCQRSCQSGQLQGQAEVVSCPSPTQYCTRGSSTATALEEVCRESDVCDPRSAAACGPGQGCYLRLDDVGTGVLTVCLRTSMTPVADGALCQFVNDCSPGSSCWGPALSPPARWTDSDLICRRSCRVSGPAATDQDAGDEDAGVIVRNPSGCGAGSSCASFAGSGLGLSSVSVPLGQCE